MISAASILLSVALGGCYDPYVRTRADPNATCSTQSTAHCLWWPGGSTVTYRQSSLGNPKDTRDPPEKVFQAITDSWTSWQNIMNSCGSLTLAEGPHIADSDGGRIVRYDETNPANNVNLVLFRQKSCSSVPASDPCNSNHTCDCWEHGDRVIAITTTTYDRNTGRILNADIELNADQFTFTTVDNPPASVCPPLAPDYNCVAADIQNTATHEFGHSLGLDHTQYRDPSTGLYSTMYAQAPNGETSKRNIDSGSRSFVCAVYPKNQSAQDCVSSPSSSGGGGCAAAPGGPMIALALLVLRSLLGRRLIRSA